MKILSCPICNTPLTDEGKTLSCPSGHRYDVSKEGYVNLLSHAYGQHGDNKLMLQARRRFLSGGYYDNLKDTVYDTVKKHLKERVCLLDAGCGEGYYTQKMAEAIKSVGGTLYGFDISRDAVKLAAKRKCGSFFVGSAYKMPVIDASVDILTLLFSPFCREEILRVLKKDGLFLMAIPGKNHLFGLKQAIYDTPYLNQVADTEIDGFSLVSSQHIENEITLSSKEDIEALFAMTPYYYKTSPHDKEKLYGLSSLTTKTEFELLLYRKE